MTEITALAQDLMGGSRLARQKAAARLAEIARLNPKDVVIVGDEIVDALNRPEARTRWECLDALSCMVTVDSRLCDKAITEAEASLFDEDNGQVRLAALRFLCKIGATTEIRSVKVWPLLDEAIQCYHGDLEFQDMLLAITEFAGGKLDDSVREALILRMSFDAAKPSGALAKRAQQIISVAQN